MRGSIPTTAALLGLMFGLSLACGDFGSKGGGESEPLPPILLTIQTNPQLLAVPGKQNTFTVHFNQEVQFLAYTNTGIQVNDKVQWKQFPSYPFDNPGILDAQSGNFKAPERSGNIAIDAFEKAGSDRKYIGFTNLEVVP